jgi:hypothetical protein
VLPFCRSFGQQFVERFGKQEFVHNPGNTIFSTAKRQRSKGGLNHPVSSLCSLPLCGGDGFSVARSRGLEFFSSATPDSAVASSGAML